MAAKTRKHIETELCRDRLYLAFLCQTKMRARKPTRGKCGCVITIRTCRGMLLWFEGETAGTSYSQWCSSMVEHRMVNA